MRRTVFTILITAVITSLSWNVVTGLQRGVEGLWLISAVKAPGRMALDEIETDLEAGHREIAEAKIAAFRRQWEVFEHEAGFSGRALGSIMVTFGQIDAAATTNTIAGPGSPAKQSKPLRSETNQTPSAAGSPR